MNDYNKIKKISMGLFFVANMWIIVAYIALFNDMSYVDCYTSYYGDGDVYCNIRMYGAELMIIVLLSRWFIGYSIIQ